MSYTFLDGYGSIQSADSSVVSGTTQRPIITIGSVLTALPVVFTGNASVSGTVGASVLGAVPVIGASVGGAIPATAFLIAGQSSGGLLQPVSMANNVGDGGGATIMTNGVNVFNGTSWDRLRGNSSVGALVSTASSSVITVMQSPSIVGTYAEDAGHTTGDKGVFSLGVRNDAMSSITSATLDYSPFAVGPSGEVIVTNAPLTKRVSGTADLRVVQGASVTAIAAQGASVFTYVSAVQVANMGSASVLVTLGGGLGSILGYTIAPAGGGSNIVYPNYLKTGENSAFTASISGTASVLVSVQGFTASI